MELKYSRIVLKVSGEALGGDLKYGISPDVIRFVAGEIEEVHTMGVQLGVVVGGGNIFRGLEATASGMDRATLDYGPPLFNLSNFLNQWFAIFIFKSIFLIKFNYLFF